MSSTQRPDTLVQDRLTSVRRFLLQRTAGPYIWGQNPEWLECAGSVSSTPRARPHFGIAANSHYVPRTVVSICSKL
jgi:hypothetical protein